MSDSSQKHKDHHLGEKKRSEEPPTKRIKSDSQTDGREGIGILVSQGPGQGQGQERKAPVVVVVDMLDDDNDDEVEEEMSGE